MVSISIEALVIIHKCHQDNHQPCIYFSFEGFHDPDEYCQGPSRAGHGRELLVYIEEWIIFVRQWLAYHLCSLIEKVTLEVQQICKRLDSLLLEKNLLSSMKNSSLSKIWNWDLLHVARNSSILVIPLILAILSLIWK